MYKSYCISKLNNIFVEKFNVSYKSEDRSQKSEDQKII